MRDGLLLVINIFRGLCFFCVLLLEVPTCACGFWLFLWLGFWFCLVFGLGVVVVVDVVLTSCLLWFVFSLCVVVGNPTCTTSSPGLCGWLGRWMWLCFGLVFDCAGCHKLCGEALGYCVVVCERLNHEIGAPRPLFGFLRVGFAMVVVSE